MNKKRFALIAATAALVGMLGAPGTAQAAGAGGVTFACTAFLPSFPADNGTGGSCAPGNDLVAGVDGPSVAVAALAGAVGGAPYAIAGPGSLNATNISYSEGCVAGEPPLTGNADGHAVATITGPAGGTLTTDFTWQRIGVVAVISANNFTVDPVVGPTDGPSNTGVGVAAFEPILGAGNLCPTGGSLPALVEGELLGVDAS